MDLIKELNEKTYKIIYFIDERPGKVVKDNEAVVTFGNFVFKKTYLKAFLFPVKKPTMNKAYMSTINVIRSS